MPGVRGTAAYTARAMTLARLLGKTVASLHVPATPTSTSPTTITVRPRPDRASQSGLARTSTGHPVGFAVVLPSPAGFHAVVKSFHNARGLCGSGRNSPID